jgi:hypothetical protein
MDNDIATTDPVLRFYCTSNTLITGGTKTVYYKVAFVVIFVIFCAKVGTHS